MVVGVVVAIVVVVGVFYSLPVWRTRSCSSLNDKHYTSNTATLRPEYGTVNRSMYQSGRIHDVAMDDSELRSLWLTVRYHFICIYNTSVATRYENHRFSENIRRLFYTIRFYLLSTLVAAFF